METKDKMNDATVLFTINVESLLKLSIFYNKGSDDEDELTQAIKIHDSVNKIRGTVNAPSKALAWIDSLMSRFYLSCKMEDDGTAVNLRQYDTSRKMGDIPVNTLLKQETMGEFFQWCRDNDIKLLPGLSPDFFDTLEAQNEEKLENMNAIYVLLEYLYYLAELKYDPQNVDEGAMVKATLLAKEVREIMDTDLMVKTDGFLNKRLYDYRKDPAIVKKNTRNLMKKYELSENNIMHKLLEPSVDSIAKHGILDNSSLHGGKKSLLDHLNPTSKVVKDIMRSQNKTLQASHGSLEKIKEDVNDILAIGKKTKRDYAPDTHNESLDSLMGTIDNLDISNINDEKSAEAQARAMHAKLESIGISSQMMEKIMGCKMPAKN